MSFKTTFPQDEPRYQMTQRQLDLLGEIVFEKKPIEPTTFKEQAVRIRVKITFERTLGALKCRKRQLARKLFREVLTGLETLIEFEEISAFGRKNVRLRDKP